MKKMWLVAKTTYRNHVRSSTFLLLTFGLPLLMVAAGGISVLTQVGGELPDVGVVDQTGELSPVGELTYNDEGFSLLEYADRAAAEDGVSKGEVAGFIILPEDYFKGGTVQYYGEEEPNEKLTSALDKAIRVGMVAGEPSWQVDRWSDPAQFTYLALDSGVRVTEGPAVLIRVVTPVFFAFIFVFAVFTGANQLGTAVVQEKDQRTMEIVITSTSPLDLVVGKILGMTLLSMTQITAWVMSALVAVGLIFGDDLAGHALSIPWQSVVWAVLLCVPGYFLYATVGAGLGIIAGGKEQARQLAGLLGFIGMAPFYLMGVIVDAMDGPLAVGLSLFPFTAPSLTLFRLALTDVPVWQLLSSFGILVAALLVSVWIVARIFRATMLLYGQKLSAAEIVQAISKSRIMG